MVGLYYRFAQKQTKAGSAIRDASLKHMGQKLLSDAASVILHFHLKLASIIKSPDPYLILLGIS